eukprot:6202673-Pleurochrysis_carterae.AAC.2
MDATRASSPAAVASASTSRSMQGWLSRSASTFVSRGTDTPGHCPGRRRAARSSVRIGASALVAAFSAAAAGSQSPTAITARRARARAVTTASATAQLPKSSAAGMDRRGSSSPGSPLTPPPVPRCWAFGAADRASAPAISGGHASETSHTRRGSAGSTAYPPTSSTPLSSEATSSVPSSPAAGKVMRSAIGTSALAFSSSSAASSSATHPACARPPLRRRTTSSAARQPLPASAPLGGPATAQPSRRNSRSSGSACPTRLHSLPTRERAWRQLALAACIASARACALYS